MFKKDFGNFITYFPFKLILGPKQIVLIDGEIVHGGGIMPSCKRCHLFICRPCVYENKQNEHCFRPIKEGDYEDMQFTFVKPVRDFYIYDEGWVRSHIDESFLPCGEDNYLEKILNSVNNIQIYSD